MGANMCLSSLSNGLLIQYFERCSISRISKWNGTCTRNIVGWVMWPQGPFDLSDGAKFTISH